ncbi:MAG: DUF4197 domain-containing protein [Desulfuromonas sp.]|nr:DUF4197 domain-containing protein [Desulfuromonas sp.]
MFKRYCMHIVVLVLMFVVAGCVELSNNQTLNSLLTSYSASSAALDENTIAAGLRQALEVGSEKASLQASASGGFLNDEKLHIQLPEKLSAMTNTLRNVGLGAQVDKFEVGMNRAAEAAAAEAKPVLVDAIKEMSLSDAMSILQGSDTSATEYFRAKTGATLQQRFTPVIADKMQSVGVYSVYSQLKSAYTAIPFASKPDFDLETYLTDKTQDGLFYLIAQEEKKIRSDPAARTTELLQRVFAAQ